MKIAIGTFDTEKRELWCYITGEEYPGGFVEHKPKRITPTKNGFSKLNDPLIFDSLKAAWDFVSNTSKFSEPFRWIADTDRVNYQFKMGVSAYELNDKNQIVAVFDLIDQSVVNNATVPNSD